MTDKCCGNCAFHNVYQYPDTIFCFYRFGLKESGIMNIFDCCDGWEEKAQECNCLEDSIKLRENFRNEKRITQKYNNGVSFNIK